ncbi:G-patch domain-containing protein [Psidium guajava]|nr:G-patch domain-containing protein [Psidium guajava]
MGHHEIEIEEVISPAIESGTARSAAGSIGKDQLRPMTKCEQFVAKGTQTVEAGPVMDHHAIEIEEVISPAVESGTARSAAIGEEAGPVDANARLENDAVTRCLESVKRGLEARESRREISCQGRTSPCTIFRIPKILHEIDPKAVKPELVSIGPYHWGEEGLREFEEHKWFFLKSFLRRTERNVESLINLVADKASSAWDCYSEPGKRLNAKFVEMMLLDGCFVVEILLQICSKVDKIGEYNPILTRQGIIPILVRDILKLENQIPYSLLQSLFECSISTMIEVRTRYLFMLALRVFNLVYPEAMALPDKYTDLQYHDYDVIKKQPYDHLLQLFCFTLFPANPEDQNDGPPFRPWDKSIPCVTQLRPCGIKFKSKKTERFLDISFRKRVLEIPSIAVDDFMVTVLINCIALEQCQESRSKKITDYVSFMHCLINEPKDVSLLYSDGIISTLSHDDHYVVKLFNDLVKGIVFNVEDCYLSKQFKELDSYYYSNWASMIRTYFSSPWAAISVFSAFLIIVFTVTQTVYAVLGHHFR